MDRRFLALTAALSLLTFGAVLMTALPASRPSPRLDAGAQTGRCAAAAKRTRVKLPWRLDAADAAACATVAPPVRDTSRPGTGDAAAPPGLHGVVRVDHSGDVML